MKWFNKHWQLLAILLLASCLRLIGLGHTPASLYWEETALGYDAYSIWQTGKDYHGHPWPLIAFESFGDYKASGYFYVAAPFVGILGLTDWSIRLPSALAGIITVWLVYLIAGHLFGKKRIALLAALTLAIMPWHIQFSRAAFEVNLAVMWMTLGVYLMMLSVKRAWWIMPAGITFVVSVYTYQSARVLAPLLALLTLLWTQEKRLLKSGWTWLTVIICIGLMMPLLINLKNPVVSQRFAETSLFSTSPAVSVANTLRAEDGNTFVSRIIHHRALLWGKEIVAGMLAHFSPRFLFLDGDGNQRHQSGYTALLYWWCVIALGGVLIGVKNKREWKSLAYVLGWILLATIPPALTNLTPHTLRFLPAAPAFALLFGFGLDRLFGLHKKWIQVLLIGVMVGELFLYVFDYMSAYRVRSAADWQYGYKQVVEFVRARNTQNELVYVTRAYGRPSMYFLYYLGYDPRLIQREVTQTSKDQGELLAFDRYRFGPVDGSQKGLLVSEKPLTSGRLLKEIPSLDGKPVFYIYENN
jgi:4-amino-4-deoxy-L-arabinose transferase-like glycosyltransferase